MNQTDFAPPVVTPSVPSTSVGETLSGLAMTPVTSAISFLAAIRSFYRELPAQQKYFQTDLFPGGTYEFLGPTWEVAQRNIESNPASHREHFFTQTERRHLAISGEGIIVVRETETSSTKGDTSSSIFKPAGHPTLTDIFSLARLTSYQSISERACDEILKRNSGAKWYLSTDERKESDDR